MRIEQLSNAEVIAATAATYATMHVQTVPVNVYETREALLIVAPLPAVKADDVVVELTDGIVRFHAELRSAAPRDYLVHEWDYGGYEREVGVPEGFGSTVDAVLANGQLVIRVLRGQSKQPIAVHPSAL